MDSSAPSILLLQVRVPSTPSTLLSFIVFVLFLSCEKNENKQKEADLAHKKNKVVVCVHNPEATYAEPSNDRRYKRS